MMTDEQFQRAAFLAQMGNHTRTYHACKMVFTEGLEQAQAAKRFGLARQAVRDGVIRINRVMTEGAPCPFCGCHAPPRIEG